jgi:cytochrome c oxidase subunit 4
MAHVQNAEPADHILPKSLYLGIFAVLMVLTMVTVGVAYVNLGQLNIVVALTVAIIKATLVVLYFMHVRYGSRLTWVVIGAGVFWLLILLTLLLTDYSSRGWMSLPYIAR